MKTILTYFHLRSRFHAYIKKHKPTIGAEPEERFKYLGKEYKIAHKLTGDGYFRYSYSTELIRLDTGKVVMRRGASTNNLDSTFCRWDRHNLTYWENIF